MAAHLAGAVAARTTLPVIGVPLSGSALSGVDALYATVQMPKGFPVATVAIDGAANAALLAAEIFAVHDPAVAERLDCLPRGVRKPLTARCSGRASQSVSVGEEPGAPAGGARPLRRCCPPKPQRLRQCTIFGCQRRSAGDPRRRSGRRARP